LFDDYGLRRRRRVLGGRDGLGLLHDDDRLAIDLLGLSFALVSVVRNLELIACRIAVSVRPLVVR
jgi:hypothetical protein